MSSRRLSKVPFRFARHRIETCDIFKVHRIREDERCLTKHLLNKVGVKKRRPCCHLRLEILVDCYQRRESRFLVIDLRGGVAVFFWKNPLRRIENAAEEIPRLFVRKSRYVALRRPI